MELLKSKVVKELLATHGARGGNSASVAAQQTAAASRHDDDDNNVQLLVCSAWAARDFALTTLPLRRAVEMRVVKVACGATQVAALTSTGQVFCITVDAPPTAAPGGANDGSALLSPTVSTAAAAPSPRSQTLLPDAVDLPSTAVAIACGPGATAAVTSEGKLYVWGRVGTTKAFDTVLGSSAKTLESVFASASPAHIPTPEAVGSAVFGQHFLIATSKDGRRLFAWGSNADHSLGTVGHNKGYVARSAAEPIVFEGMRDGASFISVAAHGSSASALTDSGELWSWGGRGKEFKTPQRIPPQGLPGATYLESRSVSQNSSYLFVVQKDGAVYRRSSGKKGDWSRWEPSPDCATAQEVVAGDDLTYCLLKSGKVFRYVWKTGEGVVLNTIRALDVAQHQGMFAMVLAVPNTKRRIFAALHPEPLLKLATAKGLVEWLVKTGCKYEADLAAFNFAFPVLLKMMVRSKKRVVEATRANGLDAFVRFLRKMYNAEESAGGSSRIGVNKVLQSWIDSRPASSDARTVLNLTQSFLTEGEQASLWKKENMRAMPTMTVRRMSTERVGSSGPGMIGAAAAAGATGPGGNNSLQGIEMEDLQAMTPKTVALTLTLLRYQQYQTLTAADVVRFCLLTPDPSAFELYPRVAEFVDFGNTLSRWAKWFVLKGSSKVVRGERLKWLFSVVQELEVLRNFDLCFHLSGAFAWELMADIAKQSKVDLDAMMTVVRKFGDRKFWNGAYQKILSEQQSMIPLLVYHANLISGGFGGSDSVIERQWAGKPVSYINVTKFRSIGTQLQLLESMSTWRQAYENVQLKGVSKDTDLYAYFQLLTAPSDAALTILRSELVPLSKLRESGKVTSLEQLSADLLASVSARERRVVKWTALVALLESDEESVRMRHAPFLVCPRDAVMEATLVPGVVKALVQAAADLEWLASEYWLLRRMLATIIPRDGLEDMVMAAATLTERAVGALPECAEALLQALVEYVAKNGPAIAVQKAASDMERAALHKVPELDARVADFEKQLKDLKTQGGALSRAQALSMMGGGGGIEGKSEDWQEKNETVRKIREKHTDMEESLKLVKAKLEHFSSQRSLVLACQGAAKDFAVLFDLWQEQLNIRQANAAWRPSSARRKDTVYFCVVHVGPKWAGGEGDSYIHQEAPGTRLSDFQERLSSLYEPVFGRECVAFIEHEALIRSSLKPGVAYLQATVVRPEDGRENVFVAETPVSREGSSEPWKKRLRYTVEIAPTKKRLRVVDTKTDMLSPIEGSTDDLRSRTAIIRAECQKKRSDKTTAVVLQQAIAPQTNTGLLKACAQLVEGHKHHHQDVANLSAAMWDFLLAVREGLAFLSASGEEEDMRVQHQLCRSFRELLALVLPNLGPPNAESFAHAALYQSVSLMLPQGFQQMRKLVDSPMVTKRLARTASASKNIGISGSERQGGVSGGVASGGGLNPVLSTPSSALRASHGSPSTRPRQGTTGDSSVSSDAAESSSATVSPKLSRSSKRSSTRNAKHGESKSDDLPPSPFFPPKK